MLGCMVEESNLGITAAASLGAATRNITRADLDATFNMTERPFKGGIYVEDTKKLVLPDVPGFGFICSGWRALAGAMSLLAIS